MRDAKTDFQSSFPMVLHRAMDAVMPPYRQIFAEHDLTDQQWRILRALWDAEPLTVADLAEATLLSGTSLVGILDRLERRGLVSRLRSVEDRRVVYIRTTEAGRALFARVAPRIATIHEAIRARLTAEEWAAFGALLDRITTDGPAVGRTQTGSERC